MGDIIDLFLFYSLHWYLNLLILADFGRYGRIET